MSRTIAYVLCLDNTDFEASLEPLKLYRVVKPERNDPPDYIRVVDESGEDYLHHPARFALLTLPQEVERAIKAVFN